MNRATLDAWSAVIGLVVGGATCYWAGWSPREAAYTMWAASGALAAALLLTSLVRYLRKEWRNPYR